MPTNAKPWYRFSKPFLNRQSCLGKVLTATMENHGKSWKILAIIIMAFFGNFIVKLHLNNILMAQLIFPLHFGLIKSRFHYFRSPKLQISWFLSVSTRHQAPKPTLFIFGETRTPKKNQEKIWEHPGKILSIEIWDSKISKKLALIHIAT